jgi:hypothetical protein
LLVARKPDSQAKSRRLTEVVSALAALLPRSWQVTRRSRSRSADGGALRIAAPDGTAAEVTVRVRTQLDPRAAAAMGRSVDPSIVVARWLSPRSREVLEAAGWNYADMTGNLYLSLDRPGLFLRSAGADRDPVPKRAPGPNLRGPRAWALQRTLVEVLPPYGLGDLSEALDIDPGYLSRLLAGLVDELLIERLPRGPVRKVEWEAMLRQIASSYSLLGSNSTTSWVAAGGPDQFLRDLASSKLKRWVLTGSFAANRLVSVAAPEIAVVYSEDPERLAEVLRLRPTTTGGNVVTALPYDPIVFERTWTEDGIVYASIAQIAMDCMTGFGRMPAEADALVDWMRKRAPRWQVASLMEPAALP